MFRKLTFFILLAVATALEITVGPRSPKDLSYQQYLSKVKGFFNATRDINSTGR
jgi:hypothetical protein